MADDIPWCEELNLKNLINAPAIVKISYDWKAVGVQLGVEMHDLKRIEREQHYRVNDCMMETLNYWLDNGRRKSWAEVNHAVKTVKQGNLIIEQEECRASLEEKQSAAVNAVTQLQTSLPEMSVTDGKIIHEQTKLAEELEKQKRTWKSHQARWNKEDREWEGKAVSRWQAEDMVARSRQLILSFQQAQTCYRELQQLLNQTKGWKGLIEERIQVYRSILEELNHLGLEQEKLDTLESQLEKLTNTLREYELENKKCDRAVREGIEYLKERRNRSWGFVKSLGNTCKGLQHDIDQMEQEISRLNEAPITGAIVGGVAGTVVPVAGNIIGAAVGYAVGLAWMSAPQREKLSKLQKSLANKKRMMRNLEETEEHAKQELNELEKLI